MRKEEIYCLIGIIIVLISIIGLGYFMGVAFKWALKKLSPSWEI